MRNDRPTRIAGRVPSCTSRYAVILLTRRTRATSGTVEKRVTSLTDQPSHSGGPLLRLKRSTGGVGGDLRLTLGLLVGCVLHLEQAARRLLQVAGHGTEHVDCRFRLGGEGGESLLN